MPIMMNKATSDQLQSLQSQVADLRNKGYRVTMPLDANDCPKDISHRLGLSGDSWQLIAV